MRQAQEFLSGEGEAWLDRNLNKIKPENDPVLEALNKYKITPRKVLEVGSANGWRLEIMERMWGCETEGLDPCYASKRAPSKAQVWAGTADKLEYSDTADYDTVIYGWCLYLCDPEDYFKIALEGDRVLKDGGYLIVYDFHADHPYKTSYKHKKGLFSHHYDFSKLWLSHPAYSVYGRTVQAETSVTVLHKDMKNAFTVKK